MLTLGPDDILLDRHADNWQAALDSAANALAEAGWWRPSIAMASTPAKRSPQRT